MFSVLQPLAAPRSRLSPNYKGVRVVDVSENV